MNVLGTARPSGAQVVLCERTYRNERDPDPHLLKHEARQII